MIEHVQQSKKDYDDAFEACMNIRGSEGQTKGGGPGEKGKSYFHLLEAFKFFLQHDMHGGPKHPVGRDEGGGEREGEGERGGVQDETKYVFDQVS